MTGPARAAAEALARWMELRDYRGFDPFDGAASPLARPLSASRWATVAWIQVLRRLPVQLRPLLLVSPLENPKTLALAIQGTLALSDESVDLPDGRVATLALRLAGLQQEDGWGYPFPWANRHFHVQAGTPASVPSAFAVHALLDAVEAGVLTTADLAPSLEKAARFFAERLNRVRTEHGLMLSYTPEDRRAVHNASLLSASALERLGVRLGDANLTELARELTRTGLRAQRRDGVWPYGVSARDGWVDSYHVGYILSALRRLQALSGDAELRAALDRGYDGWRAAFLAGPAVALRPGRAYPVDSHAVAQGLLTLVEFSGDRADAGVAAVRITGWALDHLRRRDGSFIMTKGRVLTNRVPYLRWVQAWMFRALAGVARLETGFP